MSVWCGHDGTVDYWSVETATHLQSFGLEVELADVGSQVGPEYMPPGTDAHAENWPVHQLPVVDSAMNALGGHVALAAGRGVRVFRTAADESSLVASQNLRGHEQSVTRVALDATGERALSCDPTGQVVVWDTVRGVSQHVLRISTSPCTLGFIWNNMLAMAGDSTGRIICWELDQGRRHLQFQAHRGAVTRTAFNQDSGVLLTAGHDNAARMWNLEEGQQIGHDMCHRSAVCDVAFAYAGRFVVTCGADGHVAIWNSTDGDLLDWYFDSAPVYRVAFDKLNGTLIVAGARTVKVLSVDWQRLREVDADARSALLTDMNPADHAALFASPPARPEPSLGVGPAPIDAPLGSIMTSQQTQEIWIPEDFGRIPRPAQAEAQEAPSTSPFITATPNPLASSGLAGLVPPGTSVSGPVPHTSSGPPSLTEAMAQAKAREQENSSRATSYGIGKAAHSDALDANAFFSALEQTNENARMSRMDSGIVEASMATAARTGARIGVPSSQSRSALVDLTPAEVDTPPASRKWVVIGATAVTVAIVVRLAVGWYFMNPVWPSAVESERQAVEATHGAAVSAAETAFAAYQGEEQASIDRYRDSDSMNPEAVERAVARVQSRIDQRRAERDAQLAEVASEHEVAIASLHSNRRSAAGRLGNLMALGAGIIALLVGLAFGVKPKKKKPASNSSMRRLRQR